MLLPIQGARAEARTETGADPEATADPDPATPASIAATPLQSNDEVSGSLQRGPADASLYACSPWAVLAATAAIFATTLAGPWLSHLGETLFKPAATSFARHGTTVSEAQTPMQDRRTNAE